MPFFIVKEKGRILLLLNDIMNHTNVVCTMSAYIFQYVTAIQKCVSMGNCPIRLTLYVHTYQETT